jgi:polysaccharide export outer membrane protein
VAYFQNAQDTTYRQKIGIIEAPFQQGDILSIVVSSRSREASADFNSIDPIFKGYLVDREGNVLLPTLGKIQVAGLTKKQLQEKITNLILSKQLLVEPLVDIRFTNFEVTILGEVSHPSVIQVPSEQISLVKALAYAGDLTIYGKRENVLIVREEDGIRKTRHINLNSSDFLNSEYYYLRPNDLIYVEPNNDRIALSGRKQQVLPLALTGLSFLFVVFDKLIK